jgi:drug/metabolite transporter (DMT)-like permease
MNSHFPKLWIGVTTAILATIFLSFMNMTSKMLVEEIDPIVVTFWRNAGALLLLVVFFITAGKTHLMKTSRPFSQLGRGVIGTVGMILAVYSFSLLSLTETIVIGFTAPLFVVILSYPFLNERVGIYRTVATFFGFLGIVYIMGFSVNSLNNLLGIGVALLWSISNATVIIFLRQFGKTESALTTTFYFLLIGFVICGLYLPFADSILPSIDLYWIIGAIGIFGLSSLIVKTESYRHAPANVIAPIMYVILIWTVITDYLVWDKIVGTHIWIGAGIIIFSNLFILWREHKKSKTDEIPQA